MTWLKTHARWVIPGGVLLLILGGWLAFGYFGFQTLFIDDEADEAVPVFASGAGSATTVPDRPTTTDDPNPASPPTTNAPSPSSTTMPAGPTIVVQYEGSFEDRSHPTEGSARILNDGTEQRFLRFEDFATDNGPDLNVYLSTAPVDAPASDFAIDGEYVDLGTLTGNTGPQNYEIPPDLDLDRFGTVVIWCVRFGVAFGAAELTIG